MLFSPTSRTTFPSKTKVLETFRTLSRRVEHVWSMFSPTPARIWSFIWKIELLVHPALIFHILKCCRVKTCIKLVPHVWKVSETFPAPLFYLEKWCDLLGRTNFEINVLYTLKVRDGTYELSSWANALLKVHVMKARTITVSTDMFMTRGGNYQELFILHPSWVLT